MGFIGFRKASLVHRSNMSDLLSKIATQKVRGTPVKTFKNLPPNLASIYSPMFASHGDKTWVVFENNRVTFSQAQQMYVAVARELAHGLGVRPGDRVGIAMRNFPEFVISFVAVQSMGAVAVPLNSLWKSDELEYALKDSGCKVLFADPERLRRCANFIGSLGITSILCQAGDAEGAGG